MCRLMAYIGPPALIADVVLWPDRSIIKQSYDARERLMDASLPSHLSHGNLNGDGFGIGWFSADGTAPRDDPTPCTFTSITPAWNNENLGRLSCKITSPLVFAHVRAAYPGMPVSEQNCHPFQWGRYLWMHNGVIGGFMGLRRALLATLSEVAFDAVQSFHSDSAVAFALFLHHLPNLTDPLQPAQLLAAIEATVATITKLQVEAGVTDVSLLNFVVSDGATLIATRYVSRDDCPAATMYYAQGASFERAEAVNNGEANGSAAFSVPVSPRASAAAGSLRGGSDGAATGSSPAVPAAGLQTSIADEGEYMVTYGERGSKVVLVASEPITRSASHWVAVPRNSALVVARSKGGAVDVVQTPLAPGGAHPRQAEVQQCLEALSQSATVTARSWLQPSPEARHRQDALGSALRRQPGSISSAQSGSKRSHADVLGPAVLATVPSLPVLTEDGKGCQSAAEQRAVRAVEHVLTGHSKSVLCLRVYQGRTLFTGSADGLLKVWNLDTCKCTGTVLASGKPVCRLELAGGRLYAATGRRVLVWAMPCLVPIASVAVSREAGAVCSLCVGPRDTLYIGGQDTRMQAFKVPFLMDVAPSAHQLARHSIGLNGKADLQNGSSTALSSLETQQAGLNGTGQARHVMPGGHEVHVSSPANGDRVHQGITPGFEGLPVVTEALAVTGAEAGHCCSVNAIARCTGYVVSGGGDAAIRVWKARTLTPVKVLRGHRGAILALCAIDNLLLSGGRDNVVRVWDMEALVCRRVLAGHKDDVLQIGGVRLAAPSAEPPTIGDRDPSPTPEPSLGALFATASADGTVRLWRSRCWSCVRIFTCDSSGSPSCPFLATTLTEKYTLTGSPDGVVRLWGSAGVFARAQEGTAAASSGTFSAASASSVAGKAKRRKLMEAGVGARIDRELERSLREFVALRTVSRDPVFREECFQGAKYVAALLESLGAEIKMAQGPQDDTNPVVLGRIGRDTSRPTILFYGHYDIQPAMERDWKTDPFQVHSIDGYLYGRGTSDNKGPILAFVYAVKEMLEDGAPSAAGPGGRLPCNVAFAIEGEEENGSSGFREVLQSNKRWFEGVDLIVISNTLWVGEKTPCLTYGMRGMLSLSVEVGGPQRDLHSGNDGGVFNEPLADLTKVLASLIDSRNNIQVPGFYDGVREGMLDAADSRLEQSSEFQLDGYRAALGVPSFVQHTSKRDLLSARWCEPSLSVVDVRIGDDLAAAAASGPGADGDTTYRFGPTRFSVVPRTATGHVSIRFVPDQDASRLTELFRAHVQHEFRKLRSANSVKVTLRSTGDWWEADPESTLFRIAERAVTAQWGQPPLFVREGGTMPVASALEKEMGAPALLIPFGQASDACHLANERIARANLLAGKNVIKNLLNEVAASIKPASSPAKAN